MIGGRLTQLTIISILTILGTTLIQEQITPALMLILIIPVTTISHLELHLLVVTKPSTPMESIVIAIKQPTTTPADVILQIVPTVA